mgnify:CR=1 FL=1
MKVLTTITALLLSTTVFASNKGYKLDMELSINGKTVSKPKLIVEAGKIGTIIQENDNEKNYFEVIANEGEIQGNKGILMKFKVGHIQKDGSKKIVSHPTILTKAGEEATITVGKEAKKQEMTLKVIATRKPL